MIRTYSKFKNSFDSNKLSNLKSILIIVILLTEIIPKSYAQFDNKSQTIRGTSSGLNFSMEGKPDVNLYNGVVNISNQLGILNGKNGAELPIFQVYQSSGIKVQDYSSIIGLGWRLNVISSISRNVRGLPDEGSSGYFGGQKGVVIGQPLTQTLMNQISNGDIDTEPDQFSLNINGADLEFTFDKNGIPHFLNQNSYSFVQHPFQSQNLGAEWIVKDAMGNKYSFGGSSSFNETSNSIEYIRNGQISKSFISTWYLKNIYLIQSHETFNFNYQVGASVAYKYYSKKKAFAVRHTTRFVRGFLFFPSRIINSSKVYIDETWNSDINITIPAPKYLQEIITSSEKVVFNYSPNREDLQSAYKLNTMSFQVLNGTLLKKLEFITSYRTSSYPTGISYDKRLMLDKIKLYNANDDQSIELFKYSYNQNNLPSRNSPLKDHWGYFSENGNWFSTTQNAKIYNEPSVSNVKACALESIAFPNGGMTKYYFENNDYFDPNSGTTKLGGGLRIGKIEKLTEPNKIAETINYLYKDENNLSTGRIAFAGFPYSFTIDNQESRAAALNSGFSSVRSLALGGTINPNGAIIDTNVPSIDLLNGTGNPTLFGLNSYYLDLTMGALGYFGIGGGAAQSFTTPFTVTSSEPMNDLSLNGGGLVGYSKVTVYNSGNGREESKFTDINDYPDIYLQLTIDGKGRQFTVDNAPIYLSNMSPPFSPSTSYNFARGMIKERTIYDEDNNLLKKTNYVYSERILGDPVPALRCFQAKINTISFASITAETNADSRNVYYNIGKYDMLRKTMVLESEHHFIPVDEVTNYTYDQDYPFLLTKESTSNSDGNTYESNHFYVKNATNNISYSTNEEIDGLTSLQQQARWAVELGNNSKVNGTLISEDKIGFKVVSSDAMPLNQYQGFNGNIKLKVSAIKYDGFGRMVSFVDEKSQTNSIIYTAQGENIKVKASNASIGNNGVNSELFVEDFELTGNSASAHTGMKGFSGTYQTNFTPPNARSYILTYWYFDNAVWKFSGPQTYTNQQINGIIDDVSVYPIDARLNTFTYNSTNQMSSEISALNQTTYYEYDSFGRLQNINDQDKNIIKAYCYNYAGDSTKCFSCEGEGKKSINGICETGQKVNCSTLVNTTIEQGTSYTCTYRYLFSDGSYSDYITQRSSTNFPCCNSTGVD